MPCASSAPTPARSTSSGQPSPASTARASAIWWHTASANLRAPKRWPNSPIATIGKFSRPRRTCCWLASARSAAACGVSLRPPGRAGRGAAAEAWCDLACEACVQCVAAWHGNSSEPCAVCAPRPGAASACGPAWAPAAAAFGLAGALQALQPASQLQLAALPSTPCANPAAPAAGGRPGRVPGLQPRQQPHQAQQHLAVRLLLIAGGELHPASQHHAQCCHAGLHRRQEHRARASWGSYCDSAEQSAFQAGAPMPKAAADEQQLPAAAAALGSRAAA